MCIRYGQARALLVSHGEADTAAAVKLITGVMKRFATDKGTGRAEPCASSCLRRGQARDCFGLFGEDRIRIPKPPRCARDRERTWETALDPSRLFAAQETCLAIRVFAGGETGIRSADAIPQ